MTAAVRKNAVETAPMNVDVAMLDLAEPVVRTWLRALRPDSDQTEWPPAVRAGESDALVAPRLAEMATALNKAAQAGPDELSHALRTHVRDDASAVLAQLGAARALRIMHWLQEVELPDCHMVIAALAQDGSQSAQALRATIDAVTRAATVRRIFSPDRIAALQAACRATMEQGS